MSRPASHSVLSTSSTSCKETPSPNLSSQCSLSWEFFDRLCSITNLQISTRRFERASVSLIGETAGGTALFALGASRQNDRRRENLGMM